MTLSNQSHLLGFFSPQKMTYRAWRIPAYYDTPDCLSPEDDFKQLVSSKPLSRFSKMTFWRHQIMEDDLPGPGQFRLVV
jgi:hypothetical protein